MIKSPIIVWFRSDLRIHDNPALAVACKSAEQIIPLIVLNDHLLQGDFSSSNRNRFLFECLHDLKTSLQDRGGDLVVRRGEVAEEIIQLAKETGAKQVYYTADYTPYAVSRDEKVTSVLDKNGITTTSFHGRLAVDDLSKIVTKSGSPFKVFTPFWRSWQKTNRRGVAATPDAISIPEIKDIGELPDLESVTKKDALSGNALKGGESEARKRLEWFVGGPVHNYDKTNNNLDDDATSRLSAYLHFGCLSVREIETLLPESDGAEAWHRQLAWRDFYHYILFHFPHPDVEFQERYRNMDWDVDEKFLTAWKEGKTGYPIVDAGMRQLKAEGWMHNRARLIVGSFLTKDLGIDWREGEKHFMQWLIDGDMANNNGNWQWIASVGVDPAPLFRRLYNPSSQQERYDPEGDYVRRYVPELREVPSQYMSKPWQMSEDEQRKANCEIGKDYPYPVVDHAEARRSALKRYSSHKNAS